MTIKAVSQIVAVRLTQLIFQNDYREKYFLYYQESQYDSHYYYQFTDTGITKKRCALGSSKLKQKTIVICIFFKNLNKVYPPPLKKPKNTCDEYVKKQQNNVIFKKYFITV